MTNSWPTVFQVVPVQVPIFKKFSYDSTELYPSILGVLTHSLRKGGVLGKSVGTRRFVLRALLRAILVDSFLVDLSRSAINK